VEVCRLCRRGGERASAAFLAILHINLPYARGLGRQCVNIAKLTNDPGGWVIAFGRCRVVPPKMEAIRPRRLTPRR